MRDFLMFQSSSFSSSSSCSLFLVALELSKKKKKEMQRLRGMREGWRLCGLEGSERQILYGLGGIGGK